jgi:polyferredoxin
LFVVLSNGDIRNRYQIRLTNKLPQPERFVIAVRDLPASVLDLGGMDEVVVKPGHSIMVQASIVLTPEIAARTNKIRFSITPQSRPEEKKVETAGFHYQASQS